MKKMVISLILISVLVQSTANFIIHLNFLIHQEYIAKNLCENRDKPILKCNGKCHLKKELEKTEKQEKKQLTKRIEIPSFFEKIKLEIPDFEKSVTKEENNSIHNLAFYTSHLSSIFHPPQS